MPSLNEFKGGIFVGSLIRKILKDENFDKKLSVVKLTDWRYIKRIVSEFL